MSTAREILRNKGNAVWSIEPEDSILKAIEKMAEKEIGALLVMQSSKLVGIITERDYVRKVALEGRSSRDSQVKDIMSVNVLCAQANHSVQECMAMMSQKRARHLPVIENQEIIGVVSIGDLVKDIINEQRNEIESLQYYINH
ncbi:MAG: CBS domain-containing protein [Pseudomonadota bacterium]|nr:CBS domain-containing protein [Pseudomonadota bacterium]